MKSIPVLSLSLGVWICRLAVIVLMATVGVPAHAQFRHALTGDRFPWSRPVEMDGNRYRFIVLADKTGGPETGAFLRAIDEINRLAPDFVVSIGDLIDGYVASPETVREQWNRLMEITGRIEAPLFFVGGNHDLSNEIMRREWADRFGVSYYHFRIGRDLFLVLDTEEPDGISEQQADYFAKVLKQCEVRWIYLFMHRPLWYPSNHGGFERIEPLLAGKNFTLFSGHEHRYYMENRNGHEYYIVATTGGDSGLRHPLIGELDHYLHVTARDSQPAIANLQLGCMMPNDLVNSWSKPMVDALTGTDYIKLPSGVLLGDDRPEYFAFEIRADNPCRQEMRFTAAMPDIEGLVFEPRKIEAHIAPATEQHFTVQVSNPGKLSVERFVQLPIRSSCGYTLSGEAVSIPTEKCVLLDWHRLLESDAAVDIICDHPAYVKEAWDWHGPEDGRFAIRVVRNHREVAITVAATDNRILCSTDEQAQQDRISLFLAIGTVDGFTEKIRYDFVPGQPMQGGSASLRTTGYCTAKGHTLTAGLTVPLDQLTGDRIRLNVAFTDSDDPQNTKPSVLWWQPEWDTKTDFPESGVFLLRQTDTKQQK